MNALAHDIFRDLIETIGSAFWVRDPYTYQFTYRSPGYAQLWGEQDLTGSLSLEAFLDTVHPADQGLIRDSIQFQQSYDLEYRILSADTSLRWIRERSYPKFDGTGRIRYILGVATDITDRKQAAEQLQDREERFRQIAENIRDVFWILDPSAAHRQFYVSPGYESIWGRSRDTVNNDPFSFIDAAHPSDVEKVRLAYDNLMIHQQELDIEFRIIRPDGEIRWIHDRGFIVRDPKRANRFVGIATDITERKAADELRREVERRRVIEQELREFTIRLEQSNRELQDFAYVASHDLQEPLRKIRAFGDRLYHKFGEALGDKGLDYLERMQNAAERAQALINDLLAFSRVTTKAQPFDTANLTDIVKDVISDLEVTIDAANAQVHVDELMAVQADPRQMQQLFQNLIANSLKFHREGVDPIIEITCHRIDPHQLQGFQTFVSPSTPQSPEALDRLTRQVARQQANASAYQGSLCQCWIRDNGIGFEAKYVDRIFQVFQRLHSRSVYDGTGVGLAICRKIVERHGGSISAASVPNIGTTFIVTIPIQSTEPSFGVNGYGEA